MKRFMALVTASAAAVAVSGSPPQPAGAPRLTIEQLIDIRHPSSPVWSPDGRRVAFMWDRAGVADWYIADYVAEGGRGSRFTFTLPLAEKTLAGI